MQKRNATVAVIGAGDYIGAEIVKKFAAEGFTVFAGRRNGEKLEPLVKEIEAAGGTIVGRSLDARKEERSTAFLTDADKHAPLEVCIFNVGANVNFPILETTERVFRKVWEMACYAGFLAGREAARLMVPRGQGNIFFTGATASLRGGSGFAAFASAKFGLRAVAQSMARELGPKNIHVAHLIIDSGVDTAWVRERREQLWGKEALDNPDLLMPPASVAGVLLAALPAAEERLDLRDGNPPVRRKVVKREWRVANGEYRTYDSLFATRYSLFAPLNNKKRNFTCAFSWSAPAPLADISAAGCCRPAATLPFWSGRSARAELASAGLVIKSPNGDVTLKNPPIVQADSHQGQVRRRAVELQGLRSRRRHQIVRAGGGPKTSIIPMLNGMRHLDILDQKFGASACSAGSARLR